MKFLVTGGAGFIGSHLCERLITQRHSVVCVDNFNTYYNPAIKRKNIEAISSHPEFYLREGDILDWDFLESIFNNENIDVVVHLAARAGVRPSIINPRLYQKVNVEGTSNLLTLSAKSNISKFIMASSSSVYGINKKVPFSEEDNVDHPISPYAATKKACELLGHTYHSLYALPVTCLRFFTVYGPRQRPDMAIHKFTKMISQGEEVTLYGDGTSQRDYTFITDILDGIWKSIENCQNYHIYNLGESCTIELKKLIQLLEKAIGKSAIIKQLPDQPGDVPITYADISKAKKELGYNPQVSIEKGIQYFVKWYKE